MYLDQPFTNISQMNIYSQSIKYFKNTQLTCLSEVVNYFMRELIQSTSKKLSVITSKPLE